ncbi:GTP-binding protein HflX [Haladaptatus paucihalophilus DX253]|uniref:GTPase HflX n=1 Tax=Haladaptatus paucihalophilus DX253 TaxID=797209 RepID=E7QPU7_HALPU|nr:GTPase HflX [Haladaptatus paucihalophilus]EFW93023.1 GTP-binding protein HflX [Haladaptatus paucihalophilus DX253]SHL69463.1 GTP-binding protein HflX [Haladaptatus paucihalophilus DX253]
MKAILAKRVDDGTASIDELAELARAAGYDVAAEVTQSREEDAAYQFGEGKVAELAATVTERGAGVVIFDNQLGPYQTYNLGQRLPDGTRVIDRFRLILEIFGQRAQTRKAQLQVELAELRYELPRVEAKTSLAKRDERPGFMGLGEYDESHEQDIKDQISRIKDELDVIADKEADRRQKRRESGFDLVALAGYTNAGKSTLLQRLAAELEIGENDELHPDLDPTAEAEDRLFTTLGTTTRKADIERRDVLVTDTVGFISDLPHWLVESFKSTLDAVYYADLVLLVVDVSEPMDDIREKLVTCHDTLYERNQAPIVTVLNKIDAVSDEELEEKRRALSALAPSPVAISGKEGVNIEELKRRIDIELPAWEFERLVMPMTDETMSVVSWVHDHARVEDVTYTDDEVVVEFEARPSIVQQSRSKASDLTAAPSA